MGKLKDWKMVREAKRELSGKKTFFEWLKDKYMCFLAKKELRKEQKLKLKSIKMLKILTKYGKEMDKHNIPYNVTFANQTAIKQTLTHQQEDKGE